MFFVYCWDRFQSLQIWFEFLTHYIDPYISYVDKYLFSGAKVLTWIIFAAQRKRWSWVLGIYKLDTNYHTAVDIIFINLDMHWYWQTCYQKHLAGQENANLIPLVDELVPVLDNVEALDIKISWMRYTFTQSIW